MIISKKLFLIIFTFMKGDELILFYFFLLGPRVGKAHIFFWSNEEESGLNPLLPKIHSSFFALSCKMLISNLKFSFPKNIKIHSSRRILHSKRQRNFRNLSTRQQKNFYITIFWGNSPIINCRNFQTETYLRWFTVLHYS